MASPELAVLGNLLLDDVVHADGRTRMAQPGGAALYAALGAALWGVRVGIVTRIGDDYPRTLLERLARRGVTVAGEGGRGRPTLRTWLLYEGRRRRVVHRLDGPDHDRVSPRADEIPAAWRPRAIHLAPMPWSVQRALIEALGRRREVELSADPYELLTAEKLSAWHDLFSRIDSLFFSEDEMQIADGLERPGPVLRRLAGSGEKRLAAIFYKRGARGGLVWRRQGITRWPGRHQDVIDPTGAGDAFAGGVLAARLRGEKLARQLEWGLVSAGHALEAPGADGLFAADRGADPLP